MRFLAFVALQFAFVSTAFAVEPRIVTTSAHWSPLLRSFGEGAVAVELWKTAASSSDLPLDESAIECRAVELTHGSILVYDAAEDQIADQFWRARIEAQGVRLVEIRDRSRTHSSRRAIAALEAVHSAAVKAMPDRRVQLDVRLQSEKERCSRSPQPAHFVESSSDVITGAPTNTAASGNRPATASAE